MKKIIKILCCAAAVAQLVSAVYADGINVNGGTADRIFDADRTLYYIKPDNADEIPQIDYPGGTTVKQATATDGGINSVTVIKDNTTNKEYRFVMKDTSNNLKISDFSYEKGEISFKASSDQDVVYQVIILKPCIVDSEEASYKTSDINRDNITDTVLELTDYSGKSFDYQYTFSDDAEPGYYRVVVCGENVNKSVFEKEVYYTSERLIDAAIEELNALTSTQYNEFLTLISAKYKLFNLDLNEYNTIKDKKLIFQAVAEKNYPNSANGGIGKIGTDFYSAVAVSLVNERGSNSVENILTGHSEVFNLDFDGVYSKLSKPEKLYPMFGYNYTSVEEIENYFKRAAATQYINEASGTEITAKLAEVRVILGISDNDWAAFVNLTDNTSVYNAVKNKDFKSPESLVTAFKTALGNAADTDSNKPHYSGGSSGSGSSGSSGGFSSIPANGKNNISPDSEKNIAAQTKLTDIDNIDWAKEQILYLYESGIISGKTETEFYPNDTITREEYVKLLVSAFSLTGDENAAAFSDVDKTAWYAKYISIAVSAGIVSGISEKEFGVGQQITRQDMCVLLKRALDKNGVKLSNSNKYYNVFGFADKDDISDYALEAAQILYKNGIIAGIDENTFAPLGNATRAMAAVVIYRALAL